MSGRVMIVTGSSSGIGFATASYLAEGGNDVVLASKDPDRGLDAVAKMKRKLPNCLVSYMELDLASTTSIRAFVNEFVRTKKRLNVLVHNAARAPNYNDRTRHKTADGFELTMAINHLGPILLTTLLLESMVQTASIMGDGRIIFVSCSLGDNKGNCCIRDAGKLDTENFQLQKEGTYSGLQAYKNSKLCNVLTSYHLSDLLKGTSGITVNSVDPGFVCGTSIHRNASTVQKLFSCCCLHGILNPWKYSEVASAGCFIGELAVADRYAGKSGKFFRGGEAVESSSQSYHLDLQKEVWEMSSRLVGARSLVTGDGFDSISLSSNKA